MTAGVPEISRVEMGWGEHIMQNASTGGREVMGKDGDGEGRRWAREAMGKGRIRVL